MENNNNLAYISIIAIVAVVGIIGLIMMVSGSKATTPGMDFAIGGENLAGDASYIGSGSLTKVHNVIVCECTGTEPGSTHYSAYYHVPSSGSCGSCCISGSAGSWSASAGACSSSQVSSGSVSGQGELTEPNLLVEVML
jgi:hypothetical protein